MDYKRTRITRAVISLLEASSDQVIRDRRSHLSFDRNFSEPTLTLEGDSIPAFYSIVEDLLSDQRFRDRFSERYISNLIGSLLLEIRSEGIQSAEPLVQSLLDELNEYENPSTVYLPLDGIGEMRIPSLSIGKVELRRLDDDERSAIRRDLDAQSQDPDRASWIDHCLKIFGAMGPNTFRVCSVYQTSAESRRAIELAHSETCRALDALNFATAAVWPDYPNAEFIVAISGELLQPKNRALVVSRQGSTLGSHPTPILRRGPLQLIPSIIRDMDEVGLSVLSQLIASPESELSEFDSKIVDAVHWFSTAKAQIEPENSLLNLVTCLEIFLNPHSQDRSITSAVSMGTAIVLADDYDRRREIYDFVKSMYSRRSSVSHGGHRQPFDSEIIHLRNLAAKFISRMIQRRGEFGRLQDLRNWLEKMQLS